MIAIPSGDGGVRLGVNLPTLQVTCMSDVVTPFVDNWDYLKVELNWVDRLLQLAVARQRKETKAVDRVAQTKGDRVTSHWWKGLVALDGQMTYDTPPDAHAATTATPKIGYQQQLEARIQASYRQGITLGLPSLRDRLHLTKFEKSLVLLALAPEVNQRHARLYAYLQGQDQAQLPLVNLVLKLLCANDAEWRVAREQLAVASPLRHLGLVHLLPESVGALLNRSVKLADTLVNYLLAETPTPEQLEQLLQLPIVAPTAASAITLSQGHPVVAWSDLVLPAPLITQLQALALPPASPATPLSADLPLGLLGIPTQPIVLFAGPPGTGKTTAAAAMAHQLNQPLAWVDLATIHPDAYADWLATIAHQAPAILLVRSAQIWFGHRVTIAPSALAAFCQQRRQLPQVSGLTLLAVPQRSMVRLHWQAQCDQLLDFPRPDAVARRALWQQAFAATLPPIATLDGHSLAQIPDLTGGDIQHIVQLAARLATRVGATVIDREHLIAALAQWQQQPCALHPTRPRDRRDWATVVTYLPDPSPPRRRKRPARRPATPGGSRSRQ